MIMVIVECSTKANLVMVFGEITTKAKLDFVRDRLEYIGYDDEEDIGAGDQVFATSTIYQVFYLRV